MINYNSVLIVGTSSQLNELADMFNGTVEQISHVDILPKNIKGKTYDFVVTDVVCYYENKSMFFALFKYNAVIVLVCDLDEVDVFSEDLEGVDEIVFSPVLKDEMLARVALAMSRHASRWRRNGNTVFSLNRSNFSAYVNSKNICLTSSEFFILEMLVQRTGLLVKKSELAEKVLSRKYLANDRRIDVHISRIRKKLSETSDANVEIKTVRGQGYILCK